MLGHAKYNSACITKYNKGHCILPLNSPNFKSILEKVISLIAHWDFLSYFIGSSKNSIRKIQPIVQLFKVFQKSFRSPLQGI